MKMYSIYDSKSESYQQPVFAQTRGVVIRSLSQACADVNHDFHKFAADFTLFEIGEFDERTGMITPHASKENLGCLIEFKPAA